MGTDEQYMLRCLQLARLGRGYTAPNPMVGTVLVYQNQIIGEGWHRQYGGPHAEVNCFNSVLPADVPFIPQSTLYVSLEPCAHFGKTPPCANLIVQHGVKRVVVGMQDPFAQVNGKGIAILQNAGIAVETGVLEPECQSLNKAFVTFHTLRRPLVVLKFAVSADGFMAGENNQAVKISNPLTDRWVHSLRAAYAGILAGSGTIMADNPKLNNRLWWGHSPVRIVADTHLRLPAESLVFQGSNAVIVLNSKVDKSAGNLTYVQVKTKEDKLDIGDMLFQLYRQGIQSVLVEGGRTMLDSFIREGLWDEAFVVKSGCKTIGNGLKAPTLNQLPAYEWQLSTDTIYGYQNKAGNGFL